MHKNPHFTKNLTKLANRTFDEAADLERIEKEAIAEFAGNLTELESALGMLRMGHHFGWKVLILIHSKRTVRKYEKILGISVREYFPERGPSAHRSVAFDIAEKASNFWKIVSGDTKIDDKQKLKE